MPRFLLLLSPSANRVYAGETARLARAELELTAPFAHGVGNSEVAGLSYLSFDAEGLDDAALATLAHQSAALGLFGVSGELLAPTQLPGSGLLDDDLVTIPKYQGKTNEQFTRLLLNLTLAAADHRPGPLDILDPLSGRGTTLETAWIAGHNAFGVEGDEKAVEAMAAYLKTWLRRKRLKHTADMTPVRREGKSIGKRFDAELKLPERTLKLTVFTGDTRTSAKLYGKKKFDAVVTDAPYGVVHGSHTDVRGHAGERDRSPAGLLREALPVWASQLKPGGALGLSWNTHGLTREDLVTMMSDAGLTPLDDGAWREFSHRVDSSIQRDILVARLD